MPREKITGTDHDGFVIQVGWTADAGDVQLGVETYNGVSLLTALYGDDKHLERIGYRVAEIGRRPLTDEDARAFGREVLDAIQGGDDPATRDAARPPWGWTSVWVHLNRDGSNRLIKTLRRARDAAFGRDE